MRNLFGGSLLALVLTTGSASANPGAIAVAGAGALANSNSSTYSDTSSSAVGVGGDGGSALGLGGDASGNISNKSGDTNVYGGAIGQAPTAVSPGGHCGKGTKFIFGALEWTDYSGKCFNYHLAEIAAQQGNWELANQWVKRADDM